MHADEVLNTKLRDFRVHYSTIAPLGNWLTSLVFPIWFITRHIVLKSLLRVTGSAISSGSFEWASLSSSDLLAFVLCCHPSNSIWNQIHDQNYNKSQSHVGDCHETRYPYCQHSTHHLLPRWNDHYHYHHCHWRLNHVVPFFQNVGPIIVG